ncbi:tRNA (uridine(54)-C5)-methyltransferase TrmA [Sessilibacter sp. MAH1]
MTTEFVFPDQYESLLNTKIQTTQALFTDFDMPEPQIFESEKSHYRMRCEFKIWHESDQSYYAMHKPGEKNSAFTIDSFPVASALINKAMPLLLAEINDNDMLRRRLFQVEFLSTQIDELLITLIYHKRLESDWQQEALALRERLRGLVTEKLDFIGRSRGQKLNLDRDFVYEQLIVNDKSYRYQQLEGGFTQPNAKICEKMLAWAVKTSANFAGNSDLLELYCGNGNFTLPLAQNFNKVLATEIAKTSVAAAHHNIDINKVNNITIARLSAEELVQALSGEREFRRLREIDLNEYNFGCIFVDPPRAGLDSATEQFCSQFDHILYISCNPETLSENLKSLTQTHTIEKFALFDQFPYTDHIESGVYLKRKENSN